MNPRQTLVAALVTAAFAAAAFLAPPALEAHTVGEADPYHLAPGDHFELPISGAGTFGAGDVTVHFTHRLDSTDVTDQAAESVTGGNVVGVRVPDSLEPGQYDVSVSISGTASTASDAVVWVRVLAFSFTFEMPGHLPRRPPQDFADFKDTDFGDFDGDGYLDIYSANSATRPEFDTQAEAQARCDVGDVPGCVVTDFVVEVKDDDGNVIDSFTRWRASGPDNLDRLYLNQRGRTTRDCGGTSWFCEVEETRFDQTPAGLPVNDRTYDGDFVDLDRDGDLDIVRVDNQHPDKVGSSRAAVRVLINNGGTYTDETNTRLPLAAIESMAWRGVEVDSADVNGDGWTDLLTCSWSGGRRNALLLSDPANRGSFVLFEDTSCSAPPDSDATSCDLDPSSPSSFCSVLDCVNRGCAFGDFNGDDKLDIFLSTIDPAQGDVVLINTQVGSNLSFQPHVDWVKGGFDPATGVGTGGELKMGNGDVLVADLDGDGDDDVVVTNAEGVGDDTFHRRRILWNRNGAELIELDFDRYDSRGQEYDASLADVDMDGDLDILWASRGSGFGPVHLNKGGRDQRMKFWTPDYEFFWRARGPSGVVEAEDERFGLSVSPGDFDRDGDIDMVTAGFSRLGLWTNDLYDRIEDDRDWAFVLDRTRSMDRSGRTPPERDFFEPARKVIAAFSLQRRPPISEPGSTDVLFRDRLSLVTFDYTGSDNNNPAAADDAAKARIDVHIDDGFSPSDLADEVLTVPLGGCSGNCTSIGWALHTGVEAIKEGEDPTEPLPREAVIVLVTDGQQNQAPSPLDTIDELEPHMRLYTIALGGETDDEMLAGMASNGGKFFFAGRSDDYETVQAALREIDNDIEGDATRKQALLPIGEYDWNPQLQKLLVEWAGGPRLEDPQGEISSSAMLVDARRRNHLFLVDPADDKVRFTMSWRNQVPGFRMELVDPRGDIVDVSGADPRVRSTVWDRAHVVEVLDPLSGVWILRHTLGTPPGPVKVTGMASTELEVVGRTEFPVYTPGEAVNVVFEVTERGDPVAPGGGSARFVSPSKVETVVTGTPGPGGNLTFQMGNLNEAGSWQVDVLVHGPPKRPFVRSWTGTVFVDALEPADPDLRTASLELDKARLAAGGGDTAVATLRVARRDGTPLVGARVSFTVRGGEPVGAVTDHGDGSYSQSFRAGEVAGEGVVHGRVGLWRLPVAAPFTVTAAPADPSGSLFETGVGQLALCTGHPGPRTAQVVALDAFGNPVPDAVVGIEQRSGPAVGWEGPVRAVGGGVFERDFSAPSSPGVVTFEATLDGTPLGRLESLAVYAWDSEEGSEIGCYPPIEKAGLSCGSLWFWLLLLVVLLILIVLWIRARLAGGGS